MERLSPWQELERVLEILETIYWLLMLKSTQAGYLFQRRTNFTLQIMAIIELEKFSVTRQFFPQSNSSFNDLVKDTDGIDIFTPECDEEVLIYIIKYCYRMKQEINPKHVVPLVEMTNLHEIEELIKQSNDKISITFENFFVIAQCLENEINSELMSSVVSNLINFGVSNYTELFQEVHDIRKIPNEILVRFVLVILILFPLF